MTFDPSRPDGAVVLGGADHAVVFAEEVARLLPEADVVVAPAPRPSDLPAPSGDAADERVADATTTARLALTGAVAAVGHVAPDQQEPVRVQYRPSTATDVVTVEAAIRLAGGSGDEWMDATTIVTRLRDAGWNVEVREIGRKNVRLLGAGRVAGVPVGLDIGLWAEPGTMTVRTLVSGVHVGTERATTLVAAGFGGAG